MKPFSDDNASLTIGGMTVENGTDKLTFYGGLDLKRDQDGLQNARRLLEILQGAVQALEGARRLPAQMAERIDPTVSVKNPFE